MALTVRSEFTERDTVGDFQWMIVQPDYDDCLFLFNDNEGQFRAHQASAGTEHRCGSGGGNAAIRPYQCHVPARSLGIPTGECGGYTALDERTRSVIDEAIAQLDVLLATGRYERVVYSWDSARKTLGTGIFEVAREVTDYVVEQIEAAVARTASSS
ncbi:MAG: hypothetical protein F2842_10855 [Actinobacteria bacterium]|uniref:Unannotated protein n=1 Tax=freshwater metagenome TaxID=449393 RepID=A0A6J7LBE2_9ZZZZ|nr:hypothetical protein [Actinomycetota bacterium]